MNTRNNESDIFEIVTEFIEITIHASLYIRKLYPETIFLPKKKYGIPVFQIIHPEVRDYISECLKAVLFHLQKGQLKKVYVCYENEERVFDKVVLDVMHLKNLSSSDSFLVNLEQSLRSFLLNLYSAQFNLENLPSNANFSIQLETSLVSSVEFNQKPSFESFPWVEAGGKTNHTSKETTLSLVPLQTLDSEHVKIQMYIQKDCT